RLTIHDDAIGGHPRLTTQCFKTECILLDGCRDQIVCQREKSLISRCGPCLAEAGSSCRQEIPGVPQLPGDLPGGIGLMISGTAVRETDYIAIAEFPQSGGEQTGIQPSTERQEDLPPCRTANQLFQNMQRDISQPAHPGIAVGTFRDQPGPIECVPPYGDLAGSLVDDRAFAGKQGPDAAVKRSLADDVACHCKVARRIRINVGSCQAKPPDQRRAMI